MNVINKNLDTAGVTGDVQARGPHRNKGLTLMEMLVAVAVMAIMILAFGQIIAQTRKLVNLSEANLRGTAVAQAMAQCFRDDCRMATKDGFLYINGNSLMITTAGPQSRMTTSGGQPHGANAAIACYGFTGVLWRAPYLLQSDAAGAPGATGDFLAADLATIRNLNDAGVQTFINNNIPAAPALPQVPANLTDIQNSWRCLSVYCSGLSISWTDGTYSTDASSSPVCLNWSTGTNLWTHNNQNNWPQAVRFTFTLTDPALPTDMQNSTYEVICTIGR